MPQPTQPLRILHVITRLDVGGSAENTLLTVTGQAKRGHSVTLVAGVSGNPDSTNESRAIAAGVRILRHRRLVRNISPVDDLLALWDLFRHLRSNSYDIVHTHTSKAGVIGRIAAVLAGRRPVVHTPHGHIFYGYFSSALTKIFVWVERALMGPTSALITLSRKEKDDYLAQGIGPAARIEPVFSGIELTPFLDCTCDRTAVRAELGLGPDDFVACTVARLVSVKNHAMIVSAAAKLADSVPALRLVFVGDGELRMSLEEKARTLGIGGRIVFAGWRKDIARIICASDIFVMCSRNEGLGRAFVEAQACGVPAIGTRVGGVPEVLGEGETGYLVESGDINGLADRIEYLHNNRGELARLAANCKARVNPRFSAEVMVERIEGIYRELMTN